MPPTRVYLIARFLSVALLHACLETRGVHEPVRPSRAVGSRRLAVGKDEEQPGDASGRANVRLPHQGLRRGRELGGRAGVPQRDENCRLSVSCTKKSVLSLLLLSVTASWKRTVTQTWDQSSSRSPNPFPLLSPICGIAFVSCDEKDPATLFLQYLQATPIVSYFYLAPRFYLYKLK